MKAVIIEKYEEVKFWQVEEGQAFITKNLPEGEVLVKSYFEECGYCVGEAVSLKDGNNGWCFKDDEMVTLVDVVLKKA